MAACTGCGVELTPQNTTRRHDSTTLRSRCTSCRSRAKRARDTDRELARRLFVGREVCDICCQPERATRGGIVRLLNKDHDHATGEWRGLLCSRCNQALGLFRDNPILLQRAIDYLKNPPGLILLDDTPPESRQEYRHLG